jgi:hypothetical protein
VGELPHAVPASLRSMMQLIVHLKSWPPSSPADARGAGGLRSRAWGRQVVETWNGAAVLVLPTVPNNGAYLASPNNETEPGSSLFLQDLSSGLPS